MSAPRMAPFLDFLDQRAGHAPASVLFPHEEILEEAGGPALRRGYGQLHCHHAGEGSARFFLGDEGRRGFGADDGAEAPFLLLEVRGEVPLDAEELTNHPGHDGSISVACRSYHHGGYLRGIRDA